MKKQSMHFEDLLAGEAYICQLAHLEESGYISSLLAGMLEVGAHICQLACLECAYINC